ncbi:hypothetical protein PR048_029220 [Dryococelus australis]|uniref:Maturase K n=1 Tax=Dryococelus australis TaxID=614101 RepID=A0ABQ9GCS6_9NEOP|nr:hypothetical protein PR048_029220 [Dryococelus australis]
MPLRSTKETLYPYNHCVTNMRWKTGVIHTIEEQVKRPLQWGVCLLHFNQLPFRHLFQTLDEIDRNFFSKHQQYLLDISSAIKSGRCPEDLSIREPGPLSHSRWLTTANRVLRLYLSIENPTDEHKILVSFILQSYMLVWFHIKKSKYFTNGPEHAFEVIKSSRFLHKNLLKGIDPVIQRNTFSTHPENLLLSMISDKRDHKENYIEMIHWNTTTLSPPPLLRKVNDQEI